jgi:hypothetical protein
MKSGERWNIDSGNKYSGSSGHVSFDVNWLKTDELGDEHDTARNMEETRSVYMVRILVPIGKDMRICNRAREQQKASYQLAHFLFPSHMVVVLFAATLMIGRRPRS